MFLCLVVLAQLALPAAFGVARAAEIGGCASVGGFTESGKGKQSTHLHGQECAHCRPQVAVLAVPEADPQITVASALTSSVSLGGIEIAATTIEPLPPPTGPPAR